jgi:phosphoribosyl 1,2-cyclic phosphodiesterase
MFIRCWGARGSIPVSGRQYLHYGGNTTCLEIRTKTDEILIVDAGSGIRELGNFLLKENRHDFTILLNPYIQAKPRLISGAACLLKRP